MKNFEQIKQNIKMKLLPGIGFRFLNFVGRTIKFNTIGEENFNRIKEQKKGVIIITLHGRMYLPVYYFREQNIYGIVSPSTDGEYFARIFSRFGWKTIRGSTRKNSVGALFQALKILKAGNVLAITPDGPTGPEGKVDGGLVYLSAVSESDIIPIGVSCAKCKILKTWDHAMIPYPFTKAIIIFGEPVKIPKNINFKEIPEYATKLEEILFSTNKLADKMIRTN